MTTSTQATMVLTITSIKPMKRRYTITATDLVTNPYSQEAAAQEGPLFVLGWLYIKHDPT
jgi:hypothetical protein